jgi:hypothetical protein
LEVVERCAQPPPSTLWRKECGAKFTNYVENADANQLNDMQTVLDTAIERRRTEVAGIQGYAVCIFWTIWSINQRQITFSSQYFRVRYVFFLRE